MVKWDGVTYFVARAPGVVHVCVVVFFQGCLSMECIKVWTFFSRRAAVMITNGLTSLDLVVFVVMIKLIVMTFQPVVGVIGTRDTSCMFFYERWTHNLHEVKKGLESACMRLRLIHDLWCGELWTVESFVYQL